MTSTQTCRAERGFFLVPVLGVVLTISVLASLLSESSTDSVERVEQRVQDVRLEAIADAAIDLTMQDLWSEYQYARGEGANSLTSLRTFLDGHAIRPRTVTQGSTTEFDIFGATAQDATEWADLLPYSSLTRTKDGHATLTGARVHAVEVLRQDAPAVTAFRVRAVVSFGDDLARRASREVERLYFAGGELFRGFDFALLANNVNCIMCHATVDTADRYYNRDPSRYGTFDRVRVGTLESLKIRTGSAQSVIAGTVYTRGPVMDKSGALLAGLGGTSVDSQLFDAQGKLVQSGTGGLTLSQFENAVGDPLPAGANLYMNYPRDNADQPDGSFPEEFPPVIPDLNDNRLVDAAEYAAVAARANGTLSGGRKATVSLGGKYLYSSLPSSDHAAVLSGSVAGHLVAYGTPSSPLVIDGRVTVNGDVVIGGVVRGAGEIIARNNTYIVGPLSYQDGSDALGYRTFGQASNGTENRLTLGAGGNILVGDFLRGKKADDGVTGDATGDFNFTLSETTLFGQMEWIRTQEFVATSTGGGKKGSTSTTTVANPVYDPTYVPRYYVFRPENPVAIFNKDSTYFDVNTLTWLGKEHLSGWDDDLLTYFPQGTPERTAAAVVALCSEAGWLSDTQLLTMWDDCAAGHGGGPFALDAFLYTNNAIFLQTAKASVYGGQAVVNGGLVGADLGILVAGGLQLNYDARHKDVIRLRENKKGEVGFVRGVRLR